ncbi:hypothetical protein BEP19_09220 [Ammoniphilus oxalaticus]|uniref:Uncharacterized protein n=1 Tax=Ammoniphilus oxalaticus TaxID=66863 RepID=A0A419SKS4_9BACL|nr:hypothetical protein [Ammoniphilus oxalaticus]RKD24550.1 hypothetical protein BEP19_09220 [Ammoniphilus oxalaticus]
MTSKIRSFLNRIAPKLNKEELARIISEKKMGWKPSKRIDYLKREELVDDFLTLSTIIDEDELEEFLELALTKRTIGYPAYTFRLTSIRSLRENQIEEKHNYTFLNSNQITISSIQNNKDSCSFKMFIKEHNVARMQDILNSDSLQARHSIEILVDKKQEILTMIVGKDTTQETAKRFLQQVLRWPISTFDITENYAQSYEVGKTHFRTALIIDFVYNRLKRIGYTANFKEIKFLTGSESSRSTGIRNVTLNGNDILSSQLACEYVTVGSAVLSFKLDIIYNDIKFASSFYFKGDNYSQLKIVLIDVPEEYQRTFMYTMQNEYIDMCKSGISNVQETITRLNIIKGKYLAPDKFVFESIQNVIHENNQYLLEILAKASDEGIRELVGKTAYNNKILLDNTGFGDEDVSLKKLSEQLELVFDTLGELEGEDNILKK